MPLILIEPKTKVRENQNKFQITNLKFQTNSKSQFSNFEYANMTIIGIETWRKQVNSTFPQLHIGF
jgi:hypothetical protein